MLRLIDELEQIVEEGKGFFGKKLINEEEFFTKIARLKSVLPEDIRNAEKLARDSDRVVKSAQGEAQRLVTDAQQEAERLTTTARSQSDRSVEEARSRSDRIIEEARREAERIVADAQQHAEQLVAENSITQRAQQMAEQSQNSALQDAEAMRNQADDYAVEVLDKAGAVLEKLLGGVEQGKDQMRQMRNREARPANDGWAS